MGKFTFINTINTPVEKFADFAPVNHEAFNGFGGAFVGPGRFRH